MKPLDQNDPADASQKSFEEFLHRFQPRAARIEIASQASDTMGSALLAAVIDPPFDPPLNSHSMTPSVATPVSRSWTGLAASWTCGLVMGASLMFLLTGSFADENRRPVSSPAAEQGVVVTIDQSEEAVLVADENRFLREPTAAAGSNLARNEWRWTWQLRQFDSSMTNFGQQESAQKINSNDLDSDSSLPINFEPAQPKTRQTLLNELLNEAI